MVIAAFAAARAQLPEQPVLVAGVRHFAWIDGGCDTVEMLAPAEAARRLRRGFEPLVCHARALARRLKVPPFPAYDILELFAFVRPARFCVPTPRGLTTAVLLTPPETLAEEAASLRAVVRALLTELTASPREDAVPIALAMAAAGWRWARPVLTALGSPAPSVIAHPSEGLRVWNRIKEWEEALPEPATAAWPVEPVEARARLVRLLGADAEPREAQMRYASHVAAAFQPREHKGEPRLVVAEAGTGIGKTLGYIAPATVWAQKNRATVWISTFTRNLQRQLDRELDRAYPDLTAKSQKVVIRKGRENLFCLLNYEEAVARAALKRDDLIALGLVARWLLASRDGDLVGGDFPGWLADLLGANLTVDLTDTRGECIFSTCPHYRRCFIERSIRKARRAEIVVANHALAMVQAARGGDEPFLPTRYVFDEGHQLFDAADAAFSLELSGRETAELRRWLIGGGESGRSRRRGLGERLGDLLPADGSGAEALAALVANARMLPSAGWRNRLQIGTASGPVEGFLGLVRSQVLARNLDGDPAYTLEAPPWPPVEGLIAAADKLDLALDRLLQPAHALIDALADLLDSKADSLDTANRQRIDGLRRSLDRRVVLPVAGWRAMLTALAEEATPADFVDWFAVERTDGQEFDVGFHRHWLDPMRPFAEVVLKPAHGVLITSATLCDATGDEEADWQTADWRTGVRHLPVPPLQSSLPSPFDYPARTRALVVTDVDRRDIGQLAAAYRTLFLAAGGGGLGLFTAIQRLRAVHELIAGALEDAGIRLLAQHVDGPDLGTLIDIFRAEENACLLGTDAVRDGVDVPGRSLRLIVFERVPWPRPTLLHQARRAAFGGRRYDELLTRLRLKQAFGRLIRRADDKGTFVILDRQLPSRLATAFPEGVVLNRVGLAEAVAITRGLTETA